MLLRVRGLSRTIDGRDILDHVDLDLPERSTVCILGPSGSGKTSLLRALAGLDESTSCCVELDGEEISGRQPHWRGMAMVFQDDALFGELAVADNVAYGLPDGCSRSQTRHKVELALLRMGLAGLQDRLPHELSGGQRRRVAVARALVADPRVLLLDEPLRGLDEPLRLQLAQQLGALRQRPGTSMVHVTHDQSEALAHADRLVVMDAGRVLQAGDPEELYCRPDSVAVAELLGRATFLEADLVSIAGQRGGTMAEIEVTGQRLQVRAHDRLLGQSRGSRVQLMVRPHAARLEPLPHQLAGHGWLARDVLEDTVLVQSETFLGSHLQHVVETDRGNLVVHSPLSSRLGSGRLVRLVLDPKQCWVLPAR